MGEAETEIARLISVMAALRDPRTGCPWDREQDFSSIAPYTIEEAYEVADAIARNDWNALPDELGDLLFQVVYHARMAEEAGRFAFADVARAIADKMVRRHPHVFGDAATRTVADQTVADQSVADQSVAWEAGKSAERASRRETGALAGVAIGLPALTRAAKITGRAARVGFDWPDANAVFAKLDEEVAELRAELPGGDADRIEDELGDLLFVVANLARKLDVDPEAALRRATLKFERRFAGVEAVLAAEGVGPKEAGLDRMEAAWGVVKRLGLDTSETE